MQEKIVVRTDFELTHEQLEALVFLYQPTFSFNALNLYITLYEFGRREETLLVQDLYRILNEDVDVVLSKREELERMNLCVTFHDYDYEVVLKAPLSPYQFMAHSVFGRLFAIVMGQEAYKNMVMKYPNKSLEVSGTNISKKFDVSRLSVWDESHESFFEKAQKAEMNHSFDVEFFFDNISDAIYPYAMRTLELKNIVKEAGDEYQVDMPTMRRILIDNSDFETGHFNMRGFVFALEKAQGRMKVNQENPYDVDPISFLRYKQGYDYVGDGDRNLVNSLSHNFGFNNQVINRLLEYVLEENQGNLGRAFVEKIAGTWKRNNIETLDDVKKFMADEVKTKPKISNSKKHVAPVPEYQDSVDMSDQEEAELREKIKAMLEGDER